MRRDDLKPAVLTLLTAVLLAAAPLVRPADGDGTSARELGRKLDEAALALKNYSVDQRDAALKNAKKVLDQADARIDALERDMNRNWDTMSGSARERAQQAMRELRRQRRDLSQSYGELKRSSAGAWDEVKNGFAKSYDALRDAFSKAAKEF